MESRELVEEIKRQAKQLVVNMQKAREVLQEKDAKLLSLSSEVTQLRKAVAPEAITFHGHPGEGVYVPRTTRLAGIDPFKAERDNVPRSLDSAEYLVDLDEHK